MTENSNDEIQDQTLYTNRSYGLLLLFLSQVNIIDNMNKVLPPAVHYVYFPFLVSDYEWSSCSYYKLSYRLNFKFIVIQLL